MKARIKKNKVEKVLTSSIFLMLILLCFKAECQQKEPVYNNIKPVSPQAFHFLKYIEVPVSEYTGIADIKIPIQTIDVDNITFPLDLTYYSSGVRVNEEASSVGLGWNLQLGSIVQTINDVDDRFSAVNGEYKRLLPDCSGNPTLSEFPLRYKNWPFIYDEELRDVTWPVPAPIYNYGFSVSTGGFMPVNGDYNINHQSFFQYPHLFDSEPDIFSANFLGHSLNFVLDWKNADKPVVLNQKGYNVVYARTSIRITVPSGERYTFELKSTATCTSTTTGSTIAYSPHAPIHNIFLLTEITTKNSQTIKIAYQVSDPIDCFPSYSQTFRNAKLKYKWEFNTNNISNINLKAFTRNGTIDTTTRGNLSTTSSIVKESKFVPSSIVFPTGRIDFYSSSRRDITQGRRIDSITVSSSKTIKIFRFKYSYFSSAGASELPDNSDLAYLRLRLDSVIDGNGGIYKFAYDGKPLPRKDSFSQDYWGFYNGSNNVSLIPNAARHKRPELGNNGNNKSSNLEFSRASMLKKMIYPSGGEVEFNYELNSFSNYWVPDYDNENNQVSHGMGLRISSIIWKDTNGKQLKKVEYEYSGGKALIPLIFFTEYQSSIIMYTDQSTTLVDQYLFTHIDATGYFASNSLINNTGVGYDEVRRRNTSSNTESNGKVVSRFFNREAIVSRAAQSMSQIKFSVPALKDWDYPDNGSVKSVLHFNDQNIIAKKEEFSYLIKKSPIHYGVRTYSYTDYVRNVQGTYYWPQNLLCYYPIADSKSLVAEIKGTEYFGTDSVESNTKISYNDNNLEKNKLESYGSSIVTTSYTYSSDSASHNIIGILVNRGNISEKTGVSTFRKDAISGLEREIYRWRRKFAVFNGEVLPWKDVTLLNPASTLGDTIVYDKYSATKNRLLQTTHNGLLTSYIWGYNDNYPIAIISNGSHSIAESILGSSSIQAFSKRLDPNIEDVNALIQPLRTDMRFTNAHIRTYAHLPLVGLSGETDERGQIERYQYDRYNRLAAVLDDAGRLTRSYHYNQVNQSFDFYMPPIPKPKVLNVQVIDNNMYVYFTTTENLSACTILLKDLDDGSVRSDTGSYTSPRTQPYVNGKRYAVAVIWHSSDGSTSQSDFFDVN